MKKYFLKVTEGVHHLSGKVSKACNKAISWCEQKLNQLFGSLPTPVLRCVLAVVMLSNAIVIFAQSTADIAKGASGFQAAANGIWQYQAPVQKLLYAIAGVISIVGGFNIFWKMHNGDQDVKKTIVMVVGGCVAFLAAAASLPLFFKAG